MALTGSLKCSVQLLNSLTTVDLSTPSESINQTVQKTIASGKVYHDTKALTALQVYELDFTDASLSDVFGNTISLATVTGFYIEAATANTGTIQVTSGVSSWLSVSTNLAGGEALSILSDIDVSTNTKLYIEDSGDAGSFSIIVTGTE